jgi:hypothetical protein
MRLHVTRDCRMIYCLLVPREVRPLTIFRSRSSWSCSRLGLTFATGTNRISREMRVTSVRIGAAPWSTRAVIAIQHARASTLVGQEKIFGTG